jgi:hypothetical protein
MSGHNDNPAIYTIMAMANVYAGENMYIMLNVFCFKFYRY